VHAAYPAIGAQEDFRPYDGRSEVLVRWGPELFRLLPGSLERPTAMVDQHILLASVIDRVLIPRLGFGLFDVGELILRRLDDVACSLAPRWPDGAAVEVDDNPGVTQVEIDAAGGLPSLEDMLQECVDPRRAAAAAARYTLAAKDLRCDPSDPVSTFGTAIATRRGDTVLLLPAGFLSEALPAIGTELAAAASQADPHTNGVFAGTVGNRIGRLFQGSGHVIEGPIRVGPHGRIHSLSGCAKPHHRVDHRCSERDCTTSVPASLHGDPDTPSAR
jgi:hypothetical protein